MNEEEGAAFLRCSRFFALAIGQVPRPKKQQNRYLDGALKTLSMQWGKPVPDVGNSHRAFHNLL